MLDFLILSQVELQSNLEAKPIILPQIDYCYILRFSYYHLSTGRLPADHCDPPTAAFIREAMGPTSHAHTHNQTKYVSNIYQIKMWNRTHIYVAFSQ